MKIVRILLVLLLTLFWATLALVFLLSSATYMPIAVVTTIYCLLIYLVCPIGTAFSEVAAKRLFIVLGAGVFLVALNVVLTEDCPNYPIYLWLMYPKQSLVAAMAMLTCTYLGKYPASLILVSVGCYFIYLGFTLKPNSSFKRDALKRAL
jgi:hypothetical protein